MALERLKVSDSELLKYVASTTHCSKRYCLEIFSHILSCSIL